MFPNIGYILAFDSVFLTHVTKRIYIIFLDYLIWNQIFHRNKAEEHGISCLYKKIIIGIGTGVKREDV